ncbi:MAG: sulfatase-like hydrolase/transferase, partial [Planctomycetaceae bacterium]|nr:sulfatase-like hydrolase/transferase [Planctomycetaceae bacterium]
RKELSHYYSSVRRADDCVGAILKALDESGQRDETMILFLSDHGMPLPFAKTQVYHHSSHTPMFWIVPGTTTANSSDETHLVSAVDLLPTLLEVTGIEHPGRMDGRSFAPLLRGETQDDRNFVIKEYNENAGGSRDPMRSIQTEQYLYIFNPWSNGERIMATATTGTPTYRRMAQLAKTDPWINARHDLYQHRVPEELYDMQNDPDCLNNLIDSQGHQPALNALRTRLDQWMVDTNDGMLDVFRHRDDPSVREAYVAAQEQEADARRNAGRGKGAKGGGNQPNAGNRPNARRRNNLIEFVLPEQISAGQPVTIQLKYSLTTAMGEQDLTVTLKAGNAGMRLDRQTVKISANGTFDMTFSIPAEVPNDTISFAAFVGPDFQHSLQHIQSEPQIIE